MITRPGFYFDMPEAEYRADPCPTPSITQSLAKIMLERSPLHVWHAHPRLNLNYQADNDTKFDIGNIAHALLIGRGKKIVPLEQYDDWRTKEARETRAKVAEGGGLAVLGKHFMVAQKMVAAAREQLELCKLGHLFTEGTGETVIAWQERTWCRQMIDWLTHDHVTFADYKTTLESAAPHALARKLVVDGWDVQGAMADRGLNALEGEEINRRFLFVVQEAEPPYCLTVVELSETALTMGRKKLDVAINLWNECIKRNLWPGYPRQVVVPDYPGWGEAQWLEREETEFSGGYDTLAEREIDHGTKVDRLVEDYRI